MMLLGAGASVEAGIPGALEITRVIVDRFRNDRSMKRYGHVISFVLGGLLFEAGKNDRNPLLPEVNVEALFNAVQLLADRHNLEASSFVGSWHAMVEQFDKDQPSTRSTQDLVQSIYKSISEEIRESIEKTPSGFERDRIDSALKNAVTHLVEAILKNRSAYMNSSDSVGRAVESYIKETTKGWSDKLRSARPSSNFELDRAFAKLVDERQT